MSIVFQYSHCSFWFLILFNKAHSLLIYVPLYWILLLFTSLFIHVLFYYYSQFFFFFLPTFLNQFCIRAQFYDQISFVVWLWLPCPFLTVSPTPPKHTLRVKQSTKHQNISKQWEIEQLETSTWKWMTVNKKLGRFCCMPTFEVLFWVLHLSINLFWIFIWALWSSVVVLNVF